MISCLSYTSLECLYNWLLEVDCERVLSIMCHEKVASCKHSEMPHRKMYCRSLLVEVVQQCFDEQKLSLFESLLESFKLWRIALPCGRCEFVQLAYHEEKN